MYDSSAVSTGLKNKSNWKHHLFHRCLLTHYLMCHICFALRSWRIFFYYFTYTSKALCYKMIYTLKVLSWSEFMSFALLFKRNVPLLTYWNYGQKPPRNSEAKVGRKDTGSRIDFSAKKQQQFHGSGNHGRGKEEVSCHTQRASKV